MAELGLQTRILYFALATGEFLDASWDVVDMVYFLSITEVIGLTNHINRDLSNVAN